MFTRRRHRDEKGRRLEGFVAAPQPPECQCLRFLRIVPDEFRFSRARLKRGVDAIPPVRNRPRKTERNILRFPLPELIRNRERLPFFPEERIVECELNRPLPVGVMGDQMEHAGNLLRLFIQIVRSLDHRLQRSLRGINRRLLPRCNLDIVEPGGTALLLFREMEADGTALRHRIGAERDGIAGPVSGEAERLPRDILQLRGGPHLRRRRQNVPRLIPDQFPLYTGHGDRYRHARLIRHGIE